MPTGEMLLRSDLHFCRVMMRHELATVSLTTAILSPISAMSADFLRSSRKPRDADWRSTNLQGRLDVETQCRGFLELSKETLSMLV